MLNPVRRLSWRFGSKFAGLVLIAGALCACEPQKSGGDKPAPKQPAPENTAVGVTATGPARSAPVAVATSAPVTPAKSLSNVIAFTASKAAGTANPSVPKVDSTEVPMSLTGSDGSGLTLVSVDAKAVVEGPLAFTELKLTFNNPEARRREGRFSITLPSDASISRFAMKIHGNWMEGEVVEKQRARRIYEDFLHRRQDPAILEQDAGNTFRARVFPIEANENKELIVSYSHSLTDADTAYRLPLRGLPKLGELKIRAFVHGSETETAVASLGGTVGSVKVIKVDQKAFSPTADFEIYPSFLESKHDGLRSGNIALARVTLTSETSADGFGRAAILFDTSASQAPAFETRLERLAELVAFVGKNGASDVVVVAFDQGHKEIYRGAPSGFGSAQIDALRQRGALGASDLGAALDALAKSFKGGSDSRVVIMTNGVATAGEKEADGLRKKVSALEAGRVDTVTTTTARDDGMLKALATASGPRGGINLTLTDRNHDLGRLALATFAPISVEVPGAKWTWPTKIEGLQPGQATLIYADVPEASPFTVRLSGGAKAEVTPNVATVARPLLERAWVGARIRLLQHRSAEGDPDLRAAFKQQAIKLSIDKRVLSPWTALLVLETERDYARYGINRTALADILTVSADGVAVEQARHALAVVRPPPRPPVRRPPTQRNRVGLKGSAGGAAAPTADEPQDGRGMAAEDDSEGEDTAMVESALSVAAPTGRAPEPAAAEAAPARMASKSVRPAPKLRKVAEKKTVAQATTTTPGTGGCRSEISQVTSRAKRALVACATAHSTPQAATTLMWRVTINPDGTLSAAVHRGAASAELKACVTKALRAVKGASRPLACHTDLRLTALPSPPPGPPGAGAPSPVDSTGAKELKTIEAAREQTPALSGELATIQRQIDEGKVAEALKAARTWRARSPVDVLALVALGRALSADGRVDDAARAYGSLLDLYPSRADLRRFAGNLLESLGNSQSALAIDTYRMAVDQRPDHPSGYHMLAMALVQAGQGAEALDVLEKGIATPSRSGNFPGVPQILREDLSLVASVIATKQPDQKDKLVARLQKHSVSLQDAADLRFVLTWETDANDVDFHIFDGRTAHASYRRKELSSGGRLYADVTRGYGPECFAISKPAAYPYSLYANYYSKGPMGYGMGRLQVIRSDGDGGLDIESRPFVVMDDKAWAKLGVVKGGK